jgi:Sec-independent protein translocase protein TatA
MGGLSIWHWIIVLAVILIPIGIVAAIVAIARKK